jgi:O-antigen ligase
MRKVTFYFVFALVFTIPWQNIVVFSGLGTVSRVIGFGAIAFALVIILTSKKISEVPLILILMVIYVFWNLSTYFWSVHPPATISRFITNIQLLAMVWLIWEVCKQKDNNIWIMQAYILGAYVAIVDMLITYFTGQAESFRIAATGFNPNWLAISFAIGIPMAWYLLKKLEGTIFNLINLLYIPLAIFCVILTASRGGLVTTLFACLIIPLTIISKDVIKKYIYASIILLVIIIIPFFIPGSFSNIENNIDRLLGTRTMIEEGSLSYREVIWRAGFDVFSENSIIGVGSGGFRIAVEEYLPKGKAPHNAYLSVLVDSGIIGLLLFVSIYIIGLLPNLRLKSSEKIFYIILTCTMLIAFIPANLEANKVSWIVMAVLSSQTSYVIRNSHIYQIYK